MTQQNINIGTSPNDRTGDPIRSAFAKCEQNFSELYALLAAITAGANSGLDTFLEVYTQFAADESAAAALTTTVAGKLAKTANLSDLSSAATARSNLGLGSAATLDAGTAPGQVVQFGNISGNPALPASDASALFNVPASALPRSYISGLVLANNSGAPTTSVDISVGVARDSGNTYDLSLTSTLTKRINATWAVGSTNGGLDTGSVATSTWYYVWLIRRSDTGVVDALFSTSATSPTMPANYDAKRLLGSIKTDGSSNILAFTAYETAGSGVEVLWSSPPLDINLANTLTTTRRTDTLSVPPAYSVEATINIAATDATGGFIWVYCPDQSDLTPGTSAAPLASIPAVSSWSIAQMAVRTTSGTVASRSSVASVDAYRVATLGWKWSRR